MLPTTFGDRVAKLVISKYHLLPNKGKPSGSEWAVLAAICMYDSINDELSVVSLSTGSTCLGEDEICSHGTRLVDGHAEVLCRRGFILWLLKKSEEFWLNKVKFPIFFQPESSKMLKMLRKNLYFQAIQYLIPKQI